MGQTVSITKRKLELLEKTLGRTVKVEDIRQMLRTEFLKYEPLELPDYLLSS